MINNDIFPYTFHCIKFFIFIIFDQVNFPESPSPNQPYYFVIFKLLFANIIYIFRQSFSAVQSFRFPSIAVLLHRFLIETRFFDRNLPMLNIFHNIILVKNCSPSVSSAYITIVEITAILSA